MSRRKDWRGYGVVYVRSDHLTTILNLLARYGGPAKDPDCFRMLVEYSPSIPEHKRRELGQTILAHADDIRWRDLGARLAGRKGDK